MTFNASYDNKFKDFENSGYEVVGISSDPLKKQKKFVEKYDFPFYMLCDESKGMLESYKVWALKKFLGKEYMGIYRGTYLIDENGVIEEVYDKVAVKSHAKDILNDLK